MIRKLTAIFLLMISLAILLTAMNQAFINRIKQDRYFDHLNTGLQKKSLYQWVFIRSDRWRYGDLYGLSYLPQFKRKLEPFKKYGPRAGAPATNRMLYIIGDSYLADKTLSGAFSSFDNVVFLDRRFLFGPIKLDSTRQNYLMMEFTERNLNAYDLFKTAELRWTQTDIKNKLNFNQTSGKQPVKPSEPSSLLSRLNHIIFNKDLSRNIELLLFDDRLFTPFKEAKAALNYHLFGRVAKEVAVSTDKKRLFLNSTVDTSNTESAFRPLSNRDINHIVSNLSIAGTYYRSIGFKKIFLSIIPNPVSIYDPQRMPYNHLLQRVETRTNLNFVSLFNIFKSTHSNLYHLSDAHWTPNGFNIWVSENNKLLK